MSVLSVTVVEAVPPEFIRGQNLEFVMELPTDVPAGFFHDDETGIATLLACDLRQVENAGLDGFIATLDVSWEDDYTAIRFKSPVDVDTQDWPIGPVEFDVHFTRRVDQENGYTEKTFRSAPVRFVIVDGVTRPPEVEVVP